MLGPETVIFSFIYVPCSFLSLQPPPIAIAKGISVHDVVAVDADADVDVDLKLLSLKPSLS